MSVTDKSLKELTKEQGKLQALFEKEQKAFQSTRKKYDAAKTELVKFNDKYGRVLQLIKES